MKSDDGEGSALDSNMDAPAELRPALKPSSSSPASTNPPASEALEDSSSSRNPESTSSCEYSPSAEVSTDLLPPSQGRSSSAQSFSSAQSIADPLQEGSPSFSLLQEMPTESAGASPELLPRELESPFSMASSSNDQAHSSSHEEASPLHIQDVATPEQQWQDPCTQPRIEESPSVSEGDPLVEEALPLTSNSENCLSHSSTLEQPPPEACSQEEEPELSDDVKREMLTEVCKGVSIFSCKSEAPGGDCFVYLIGTAHVSEESCREVQAAVHLIKPQVVFLELCHKRTAVLQRTSFVVPTVSDMISMWKQRKTNMLGIVYTWFLAKVAAKLDVRPGAEFRAAYEEALACGAKVVLGDRDIEVTLRRTWGKMSAWHKTKLIFLMLYQSLFLPKADQLNELIEKLKDADILTIAFEELGKFSPALMETLINERDMFMTAALQNIAEHHSSIVAVVGRGHVAGITRYWGQDIPIHTLLEIPGKRSVLGLRLRTYAVVLSVALASVVVFAFR